ncbi:hypothetical protein P170DRAFT_24431 [Aspergillus steynii IBT 23096]|uniref:Uncharacterized protein n=1 Tax=Aspergillus steynii IBT 23096 TaxID=1392250 RepID=A0A2I2GPC8_9EURO|nr:uncharacterized protein P170DRAFT_24431 [Aspergillus steynii IBT 23096]PLB54729.1 hypothetical protein P170DRAFT_24431 [Aspergillus steynii IBT 23096]
MGIPTAAIIVIVVVACLAAVSLGAALTKQWFPYHTEDRCNYPRDQELYMRSVRLKNLDRFQRESRGGHHYNANRDVEGGYPETGSGSRY